MTTFTVSDWMGIISQLMTAAGIYAAIRSDLKEHAWRIAELERWRNPD